MAIQSRLTSLDQSQMDDAQRAALNQILNGPRAVPGLDSKRCNLLLDYGHSTAP